MRISDWSSDVCSSDLAIFNGYACHGCYLRTKLRRARMIPDRPLFSQTPGRRQPAPATARPDPHVPSAAADCAGAVRGRSRPSPPARARKTDRKSVGEGKSVPVRVDLGVRRIIKKKNNYKNKA